MTDQSDSGSCPRDTQVPAFAGMGLPPTERNIDGAACDAALLLAGDSASQTRPKPDKALSQPCFHSTSPTLPTTQRAQPPFTTAANEAALLSACGGTSLTMPKIDMALSRPCFLSTSPTLPTRQRAQPPCAILFSLPTAPSHGEDELPASAPGGPLADGGTSSDSPSRNIVKPSFEPSFVNGRSRQVRCPTAKTVEIPSFISVLNQGRSPLVPPEVGSAEASPATTPRVAQSSIPPMIAHAAARRSHAVPVPSFIGKAMEPGSPGGSSSGSMSSPTPRRKLSHRRPGGSLLSGSQSFSAALVPEGSPASDSVQDAAEAEKQAATSFASSGVSTASSPSFQSFGATSFVTLGEVSPSKLDRATDRANLGGDACVTPTSSSGMSMTSSAAGNTSFLGPLPSRGAQSVPVVRRDVAEMRAMRAKQRHTRRDAEYIVANTPSTSRATSVATSGISARRVVHFDPDNLTARLNTLPDRGVSATVEDSDED